MKTVILCAGRGKRLKGLTEHLPKPLVKVKGKALLEYVLEAFIDSGIKEKDIVLVTGYQRQKIAKFLHEKRFFVNMVENPDWEHTNMVHSFYKGIESLPEEDVIVSYGDIIYGQSLIEKLIKDQGDIVLPYHVRWRELWQKRFDDPLEDAETFEVDENGLLTEIGRRPESFSQIKGQYMGVFRLSSEGVKLLISFYKRLDNLQIDFTSLFMEMIKNGVNIKTMPYDGIFIEVDREWDLKVAEEQLSG
jgi:choline kinase